MPATPTTLEFTDSPEANRLLADNAFALLMGMLLDQQVTMETAFRAPWVLQQRMGSLDVATIAHADPDTLDALFRERPALHRYPGNMAKRTQALALFVEAHYGGRTEAIWDGAATGTELYDRVAGLPGFGEAKARVFVGVLGKRLGVQPPGWEDEAAAWASIADVDTYEKIGEIREAKRAHKAELAAVRSAAKSTVKPTQKAKK